MVSLLSGLTHIIVFEENYQIIYFSSTADLFGQEARWRRKGKYPYQGGEGYLVKTGGISGVNVVNKKVDGRISKEPC